MKILKYVKKSFFFFNCRLLFINLKEFTRDFNLEKIILQVRIEKEDMYIII